jgi:uncharacterized membrane protein YkgB
VSHSILTYLIAAVWLINGLICKVLDLVPRHREIVARILGDTYARELTVVIGVLEILMAIWILLGIRSRFCAVTQIVVVLTMNVIEFFLAPDLLLFGRMNFLVALVFVGIVYCNEFTLNKKPT